MHGWSWDKHFVNLSPRLLIKQCENEGCNNPATCVIEFDDAVGRACDECSVYGVVIWRKSAPTSVASPAEQTGAGKE